MKSSIGSDAFALLALITISAFVLLLLRHFLPLRTTPAYLTVPIFLALALPISIILLVPIDLASSSRTDEEALRGIWLPQGVMLVVWRLTYWLTFALTWYEKASLTALPRKQLIMLGLFSLCLENILTQDTERRKTAYYTLFVRMAVISSS